VGKLYLQPGARYYGCRHCYALTYESAQTHDKRLGLFHKHSEIALALLRRGQVDVSKAILVLKALKGCPPQAYWDPVESGG